MHDGVGYCNDEAIRLGHRCIGENLQDRASCLQRVNLGGTAWQPNDRHFEFLLCLGLVQGTNLTPYVLVAMRSYSVPWQ